MPVKGVKPGQQRQNPFEETIIWDIVLKRTALFVIDMQNAFVDEKSGLYCLGTKETVPRINRLAAICRELGIVVIWIRNLHGPGGLEMGYEREFFPKDVRDEGFALDGSWQADFYLDLDIHKEDIIVTKRRYSAFIQGSSNLDRILRYMDKDTVIITGVATNVCCGTTAMDAMMLDYKVIFVSDANTAQGEPRPKGGHGPGNIQEAFIRNLRALFAMVCTTDELIEGLGKIGMGN